MSVVRQRFAFVGVLVALLLSACASPPVAPAADDARAKVFASPHDQAVIYIYRNGGGRAGRAPITVIFDGRVVAAINNKTFFRVDVEPGAHDVWVELARMVFTPITVIAGQTYFVRVGMTDKENEAVNPQQAKQELLACCKLAATQNVAPAMPALFH